MGGSHQVYTSLKQKESFSYANVRKASNRGSKTINYVKIPIILTMISVFKFCVFWGIFLTWFADSLLFDMMIKTSFKDGVDQIQDLIDKDIRLGTYNGIKIYDHNTTKLISVIKPRKDGLRQWMLYMMKNSDYEPYRKLGMIIKYILHFVNILLITF